MKVLTCVVWLLLLLCSGKAASQALVIAQHQESLTHRLARTILAKAYAEVGIEVEFREYPAQRALEMANAGVIAGDVGRIEGIEEQYPNLVRVPTPVLELTAYAYGLDPHLRVNGWSDLDRFRAGYIHGVKYMEIGTNGVEREKFYRFDVMFKGLANGLIDVAIASDFQARHTISEVMPDQAVHILGDALESTPLFHVLHAEHHELVAALDEQLRRMHRSGRIEALHKQFYRSIGQPGTEQ